jgi:hypothetical protein
MTVTDNDLSVCVNVLSALSNDIKVVDEPRFKQLRKAIVPFIKHMQSKMYKGSSNLTEYLQKQQVRREAEGRKAKQKALDKKYIDAVSLRSARVEKLKQLESEQPGLLAQLPLIPDGFAEEKPSRKTIVPMITSGVNKSSVEDSITCMPGAVCCFNLQ